MDPPKNKQWRHRVKVSLYEGHVPIKLGLISNMTYLIWLFLVNISFFYTHIKPRFGFKVKIRAGFRVINSPHKDADSFPPGYFRSDCGFFGSFLWQHGSVSQWTSCQACQQLFKSCELAIWSGSSSFPNKLREFHLCTTQLNVKVNRTFLGPVP